MNATVIESVEARAPAARWDSSQSSEAEDYYKLSVKKRRKMFIGTFLFFVVLPVLICAFYYTLIASPQYISISKITVTDDSKSVAALSGLGGFLSSASGGAIGREDAYILKEYIKSADMADALQKDVQLHQIFANANADFLSAPPENPTKEEFIKYYNQQVTVRLDELTGLLTVEVKAFSQKDSQKISASLLKVSEKFVNAMSERLRTDSVSFAREFLKESEDKILIANQKISGFRNKNANFDPTSTATGVLRITSGLEQELAAVKTQIATYGSYMKSDNPRIQALKARESSIKKQIFSQNARLADQKGTILGNITQEYEALKLENDFAVKQYATALKAFEEAQTAARKQTKYLIRVVGPTLPEEAGQPRPLYDTLTVFLICGAVYVLGGLVIAAARDHMRT